VEPSGHEHSDSDAEASAALSEAEDADAKAGDDEDAIGGALSSAAPGAHATTMLTPDSQRQKDLAMAAEALKSAKSPLLRKALTQYLTEEGKHDNFPKKLKVTDTNVFPFKVPQKEIAFIDLSKLKRVTFKAAKAASKAKAKSAIAKPKVKEKAPKAQAQTPRAKAKISLAKYLLQPNL